MKSFTNFIFLFLIFLLSSCSEEKFAARSNKDSISIDEVTRSSIKNCSGITKFRPKVDFLFLWDNSESQRASFIDPSLRAGLGEVVNTISSDFDYRILLSPLIGSGLNESYLVLDRPDGINASVLAIPNFIVPIEDAASILANPRIDPSSGAAESGVDRSISLISEGISKGIFRKNSYLIVVLMSNGDDNAFLNGGQLTASKVRSRIDSSVSELQALKSSASLYDLRFMSLVAHSNSCFDGARAGSIYKGVSEQLHAFSKTKSTNDVANDSYDLCHGNAASMFSGINQAIQATVIGNRYAYWPLGASNLVEGKDFVASSIQVFKNTGAEIPQVDNPAPEGFRYIGVTEENLVEYPIASLPYKGHLLELYGTSKVTYPECLIVKTREPLAYIGYLKLSARPNLSEVKVTIKGKEIPQWNGTSGSTGWQYVSSGFIKDFNVRIKSPTDDSAALPAIRQSGFFIKLHGDAIFNNNQSSDTTIISRPAATQ